MAPRHLQRVCHYAFTFDVIGTHVIRAPSVSHRVSQSVNQSASQGSEKRSTCWLAYVAFPVVGASPFGKLVAFRRTDESGPAHVGELWRPLVWNATARRSDAGSTCLGRFGALHMLPRPGASGRRRRERDGARESRRRRPAVRRRTQLLPTTYQAPRRI